MSLLDSLKTLDPLDDTLWTDDGLPTIEAAKVISGDKKLTREAINKVALGLTRSNVTEYDVSFSSWVEDEVKEVAPIVEKSVALNDVDALLAKIDVLQKTIADKTAARHAIELEVSELAKELAALEITIPYREIQLENQRKGLEALMARSDLEGKERAEKLNKLNALGLTPEQLIDLLPNVSEPRYDRIV